MSDRLNFPGKLGQGDTEAVAALFAEEAEWDIADDVGALPWLGKKPGRNAVVDFIRDSANLIERLKLEAHDIVVGERWAVVLGELASRYKPNGKIMETACAVVLQISDGKITPYPNARGQLCCLAGSAYGLTVCRAESPYLPVSDATKSMKARVLAGR
ncbi:nuclear transport factor 2 family protein [Burkholderia sp. WAC0059]|uniref:nuclear transport factor 2 family protein n=1 Tax=Burkholderia sp. WAC0059 TaxID=2066022 RepID=UPI0015E0C873|nr:nuclear transport factor 2 family protein [Burkholderia sp. WAC0059]